MNTEVLDIVSESVVKSRKLNATRYEYEAGMIKKHVFKRRFINVGGLESEANEIIELEENRKAYIKDVVKREFIAALKNEKYSFIRQGINELLYFPSVSDNPLHEGYASSCYGIKTTVPYMYIVLNMDTLEMSVIQNHKGTALRDYGITIIRDYKYENI